MVLLQYLWLYVVALYPIHGIHLSASEYIDIAHIGSIRDLLLYIGIVPYLYSRHYRPLLNPPFLNCVKYYEYY